MRIAIFGSGAVGGYFGARLAQAGQDVVFLARGAHLEALRTGGLKVESPLGDVLLHPVQATDDPAEVGLVDVVLLGVKAWQVSQAAREMRPLVGPGTIVVPLQNGVDAAAELAAELGPEPVLGGLCRISSSLIKPGHIRHMAIDPCVAFGEVAGGPSPRAQPLYRALQKAGVSVEILTDVRTALWDKLVFIASLGGVGAVTRAPAGVVRTLPETRRMLESAIGEIMAVAAAHKAALPQDTLPRMLDFIDGLPPETTTSMQRDIVEGRPSELHYQNGAVARLGAALGVPAPTHKFIYASLLPQENLARSLVAHQSGGEA